jgi:aminoglycoside phosphotransferase (APT) family kinase protein
MEFKKSHAISAAKLIFPNAKNPQKINKGFSHNIFEVETGECPQKVIVKFGNDNEDKYSLKKELHVHKKLNEINIPVPKVIFYKEEKDFDFVILSKIEGDDLNEMWDELSKDEKEDIAFKIGEILGKIHSIKFNKYGFLMPKGKIHSSYSFKRKEIVDYENQSIYYIFPMVLEDLGILGSHDFVDKKLIKNIFKYFLENKNLFKSNESPSFIHGDYDMRNIMAKKIKGEWQVTSILDFEHSASMQREYDCIKLYRNGLFNDESLKKSFLLGYLKNEKPLDFDKIKFMSFTRDVGFAGFLFKSGNIKLGNEILQKVKSFFSSNSPSK